MRVLRLSLTPVALLAAVVLVESASNGQLLKNARLSHRLRPPPRRNLGASVAITQHVTQLLDHFDPLVNATWQQRYFSNQVLYEEGGPVFIFIEGEGEASSSWIEAGGSFMYSLAQIHKARMYVLEHRYFGYSYPTSDSSSENLKWLSSDQALADLAYFIEYLIKQGEMEQGQKVVVFGGSYPGNLAAWARLKYPHLIHAAVSSSAPVRATADFPEYFEVVTRDIRRFAGDACADNLQKAFKRIRRLLLTTDGVKTIQNSFYMCDPPDVDSKIDMDFFYSVLSNTFASAAQYNQPDGSSIQQACEPMQGTFTEDEAVAALAKVFVNTQFIIWGCVHWKYKENLKSMLDTENSPYASGRLWLYMTCTAFGYFQTFNGNTTFPKGYVGLPYYEQQCKDVFGDEYRDAVVQKGVKRSNTVFGSWNPDVTNVMFVNGDVDPWHALGVVKDVNPSSPAILIPGQSHCYDMYPNQPSDPPQVLAARAKIKQFVHDALYESPNPDSPSIAA